jgi:ABC-type uncharacterized transport system substrate-binding protein
MPVRLLVSVLLTLSVVNTSYANESKVLIIKSGTAQVYNKIISATKSHINKLCQQNNENCSRPSIQVESIKYSRRLRSLVLGQKWDLIITVGTKAAMQLNSYKTTLPTLYSLIPSNSYYVINNKSASEIKSAIYVDQPIKRQLQLIKSALPGKEKVGVILGKHSGIGKKRLEQIIRNMGLQPVIVKANSDNISPTLKTIYNRVDALLAQPDPSIYNKKSIMTVLLSSYRHRVPVFGYSAAFVRSGATAAIYSSPTDIGQQIADEIVKFILSNNKKLSPPGFPNYFSVDTNRRVIRSLNISLPTTNKIKAGIMKAR